MAQRYRQVGRPVPQGDQWWAAQLAARQGVGHAARAMGLTRGTVAAVIAGLPVSASTEESVHAARVRAARGAAA